MTTEDRAWWLERAALYRGQAAWSRRQAAESQRAGDAELAKLQLDEAALHAAVAATFEQRAGQPGLQVRGPSATSPSSGT